MDILNKLTNKLNNYNAQTGVQSATEELISDARQEIILLRANLAKPQTTSQQVLDAVLAEREACAEMIIKASFGFCGGNAEIVMKSVAASIRARNERGLK